MTASFIQLPGRSRRGPAPIVVQFHAKAIALALGGSGMKIEPNDVPGWYRCRCPLCGGSTRISNASCSRDHVEMDCLDGCLPERVATELIRRGHYRCRDMRNPW
jgi:hypothetical protein